MKAQKYRTQNNTAPNTGELLKAFYKKRRIHKAALARILNRRGSTMAEFEKNASIQTAVLWEICHALKHNFFADLAAQLPAAYTTSVPADTTKDERIAELELQLKLSQAKYDALADVMKR
jgi:transcriptional regulator with XRE-family HTH domain